MPVFHYVVHQYVDDQSMDGQMICVLGGQSMDGQVICVLGVQSLGVLHDQCVVPMSVTCRKLALLNESVRKLELQRCHQLVFLRAA
jgi:hypothetical protein